MFIHSNIVNKNITMDTKTIEIIFPMLYNNVKIGQKIN